METVKNTEWQIVYSEQPFLPALAWLSAITTTNITVYHGSHVEVTQNGFFEGVWTGSFRNFDFTKSEHVFGSGGLARDNIFTIVPPSHMYEYIYVFRLYNTIFASNSLSFLLSFHNGDLIPGKWDYGRIFEGVNKQIVSC